MLWSEVEPTLQLQTGKVESQMNPLTDEELKDLDLERDWCYEQINRVWNNVMFKKGEDNIDTEPLWERVYEIDLLTTKSELCCKSKEELLDILKENYREARGLEAWHVFYGQGIGSGDRNTIHWCDAKGIAAVELINDETLTRPIIEKINAELEEEYPEGGFEKVIEDETIERVKSFAGKGADEIIQMISDKHKEGLCPTDARIERDAVSRSKHLFAWEVEKIAAFIDALYEERNKAWRAAALAASQSSDPFKDDIPF